MDKLWAPWRINYVQAKKKPAGCIFCKAAKKQTVFRTEAAV